MSSPLYTAAKGVADYFAGRLGPVVADQKRVELLGALETAVQAGDVPARDLHAPADKALVTISRMSSPDIMRIRLEVNREVVDVEMDLAEFTLCLTGRGDTTATVLRHFVRPAVKRDGGAS